MVRTWFGRLVFAATLGGLLVFTFLTSLSIGAEVERLLFPVNTQWEALETRRDGGDLIVAGRMVRSRSCSYVPPPRARTSEGVNLAVTSASATRNSSWQPGAGAQYFGPWRVHGGAGKHITFFQEHRCHPFWVTFTTLGVIDDRGSRELRPSL